MPTREEVIAEARRIFAARGIDPDVALRVLQQESGLNPAARNINPKEESYGLAQLNVKGGLGAEARKRGIEPSDPNQWQRHLEFMADTVKRDGWRQWYGARDAGIGRYQGVRGAAPTATALGPKVLPTEVTGIPAPAAAPASPQTVANIQELQKQLLARYPELRVF